MQRKIIPYILILIISIILTGFFSPVLKVHADYPTCTFDTKGNVTSATPCWGSGPSKPLVGGYSLLAPLPCEKGTDGCDSSGNLVGFDPTGSGGGALGGYLNIMIRIFIGLCAVLAVIMIVWGGIEYMTSELISSKAAGKERILGAIFGLLLALGAWTLLNQINPDILNTDLTSLTNQTVEITLNDSVPQTPVNGVYTSSGQKYTKDANWEIAAGAPIADLTGSGATVYNAQCTTVGQTNCTSTRGLDPSYLDTIHKKCPTCALSIQGGTEFWAHGGATGSTSHGIGSPTVDLGVSDALNKYILSGTSQGNGRYLKDGISYLDERSSANHWHAGP